MLEKIAYGGWENCYRLNNGALELVVTADVGPRVIHLSFVDGFNVFKQFEDQLGKTGGDEWRNYGGHRLWHAPEHPTRTYYPDNAPVQVEALGETGCRLISPIENTTQLQKQLEIRFIGEQQIEVVHRLINHGQWELHLSAWALSVMAAGGTAILPLPPRGSHRENLLPKSRLALWAYTDFSDPRWRFGRKYFQLSQQAGHEFPQKIGASVPDAWAAYLNQGVLFLKQVAYDPEAEYPDLGSSIEIFTNNVMLEVESLSPLTALAPHGEGILEHRELWSLHADIPPLEDDASVDAVLLPLLIAHNPK